VLHQYGLYVGIGEQLAEGDFQDVRLVCAVEGVRVEFGVDVELGDVNREPRAVVDVVYGWKGLKQTGG
jgi:hypothetical protein